MRRQIFHLLFGIVAVVLYQFKILNINCLLILFTIGLVISFISRKRKIPVIYWFLERFEREQDLKNKPGKGILTYLAGMLIVLLIFEEKIALAAIIILAVGDSVSHMIGKYFGKTKYRLNNLKHIEGTVAGIFLASLVASLFIEPLLAFLGSMAAMITEAVNLRIGKTIIDDNLAIPIVAGITIYLVQLI